MLYLYMCKYIFIYIYLYFTHTHTFWLQGHFWWQWRKKYLGRSAKECLWLWYWSQYWFQIICMVICNKYFEVCQGGSAKLNERNNEWKIRIDSFIHFIPRVHCSDLPSALGDQQSSINHKGTWCFCKSPLCKHLFCLNPVPTTGRTKNRCLHSGLLQKP